VSTRLCSRCREEFSPGQLFSEGHGRFACAPCGEAMKAERSSADPGPAVINSDNVLAHLPHQVKDAPHLVVCACAEVFRAVPAERTAMAVWASHLTETLNVALAGAQGPIMPSTADVWEDEHAGPRKPK